MAVNYAKLVESARKHPDEVLGPVHEARSLGAGHAVRGGGALAASLAEGAIRPHELDLGALFVECYGWRNFVRCRSDMEGCIRIARQVMEQSRLAEAAGGAISSDAFLNITQQFAYSKVIAAYDVPSRVFSGAIPSRPSKFKFERVPGISHVGDGVGVVEENKPYPEVGPSEDWTDTPETRKRGMVARASREVVFFDQTGVFLERLGYLGEWLGVRDEKNAIKCVVDAGETADQQYRYRWRNNTIATYGDNSGTHTWDNLQAANTLVDYKNVATAWQLLVQILDPYTGEPQNVEIKHICVPPALAFTVPFALKGMVRRTAPGYATSGNPAGTEIPNPVADIIGQIQTLSSQLFRSVTGDDTTWFLGDLSKAFEQIENWPLTVTTMGAGGQLEFDLDVIFQAKVSKRSTFSTVQPRKVVKSTT